MAKKKNVVKSNTKEIIIGILIVIILIGIITYYQEPATEDTSTEFPAVPGVEEEGILSADGVDYIPEMTYDECITEIQATNPEMSDTDARDNCIAIDAITSGDISKCSGIINLEIKQACIDNLS